MYLLIKSCTTKVAIGDNKFFNVEQCQQMRPLVLDKIKELEK